MKLNNMEPESLELKFHIPKNRIDTEAQLEDLFNGLKDFHPVNEQKKLWFN